MNKKAKFGSYEAHQPHYEGFKKLGKLNDYIFQALAHMGSASTEMAWANTVLEDDINVPNEIKVEMKRVTMQINELQEKLQLLKSKR